MILDLGAREIQKIKSNRGELDKLINEAYEVRKHNKFSFLIQKRYELTLCDTNS